MNYHDFVMALNKYQRDNDSLIKAANIMGDWRAWIFFDSVIGKDKDGKYSCNEDNKDIYLYHLRLLPQKKELESQKEYTIKELWDNVIPLKEIKIKAENLINGVI